MKLNKLNKTKAARLRQNPADVAKQKLMKQADELGEAYTTAKEQGGVYKAQADRANESIKALAAAVGVEEGKQQVVRGAKYVVGFTNCDSSPVLNQERARKLLTPEQLKKCQVSVISPELLEKLVASKVVSRQKFLQMMDFPKGAQKIYVEFVAKHDAKNETTS